MDGIKIPFSETVKYLGVTLDSKISWKQHIENKTTACKKLMAMLNSNLRGMQAPKPKLSKWAYTGVVRPKLLYACMTWGNAINTLQQTKKLKALDRLAVKSTTTNTKTTPKASVEVMIDLLPIELKVQKVGISANIRLKSQLNNPCSALNTICNTGKNL